MTFGCKIFVNYISFDIYLMEPIENVTHTHTHTHSLSLSLSLTLQLYFIFPPLSLSLTHTHTHALSSLNSSIASFFSLFLFLIPDYTKSDLVHQPEKNEHQIRQFMC